MALGARGRWPSVLLGSVVALLGILLGRVAVETQAIEAGTGPLILGALAVAAAVIVMFSGPVVGLAALVGLTIVPVLPEVTVSGAIAVRPADAFYPFLIVWAVVRILDPSAGRAERPGLRATPTLLFVGFAGLTLFYVAAVDPGVIDRSAVSWLRFAQTVSIGFLAAVFVRSTRDVKILLAAVAIGGAVVVGMALIGGVGGEAEGTLGARGGGTVNPNALGLTSGLLVLMAALGGLGPQLRYRIPLALVGAVGLVQAKSVGGIVGTCVAVTLGLVFLHSHRVSVPGLRALRAVAALAVAVAVAYGVASAVRPENLPHTEGFQTSSAWHRTVVGAAGVELAVRNPVIGVGWRRSSEAHVIGDPDLTRDLRVRFSGTRDEFFPDAEPTSVHNAYVQVAAETGVIGVALLGVLLFSLGRDIRRLLQHVSRDSLLWRQLWYLTWGVVLVLVWLNDNPIFGGQVETVVLAALAGAIAGAGRLPKQPQRAVKVNALAGAQRSRAAVARS